MDFREMLATHKQMKADFTVAATPVAKERARDLGILKTDRQGVIISFKEKPKTDSDLAPLKVDERLLAERGAKPNRPYLASMGIYLFNREVLTKILQDSDATDFGKHIIPQSIISYRAAAHLFSGYWEDIGSIKNFFDANLDLTTDHPKFDFYDAKAQIYTRARFLPGTRVNGCQIHDSIISEGGILTKCKIKHSIVGIRSIVRENCSIAESILMGADWYETPDEQRLAKRRKLPPIGIGPGCIFERVIVDKNARIGSNVVIRDSGARKDSEGEWYAVSEGIVVIKRGAVVPDGSRL
jgi:glucose-1-phosphate adenylyltransferase